MSDIQKMQQALREQNVDAWLLYDFRGSNMLARRVLGFDDAEVASRRWFYLIPAEGEPRKLVHRIESSTLDRFPGDQRVYLAWQELEQQVAWLVKECQVVAMEYSPRNANPYVSRVDAGTVELVRSMGVEVVSSGDLIQRFEAVWDEQQWQLHLEATKYTTAAFELAWSTIADAVRSGHEIRETEVQARIMDHFHAHGMTTYHPPIVAVGPHSGDPHFAPNEADNTVIRENDFVLIDLWARLDHPRGVYSDLTRVGYVGQQVPSRYEEVFRVVAAARDAAIQRVREAFARDEVLLGWQVDQASRDVIDLAGYGEAFIHRTGHSIGIETHGNGANMDNLEMHDERQVLRNTCFSIEPGIYLSDFGIRSEVNVFVDGDGEVHVTGGPLQQSVLPVLR